MRAALVSGRFVSLGLATAVVVVSVGVGRLAIDPSAARIALLLVGALTVAAAIAFAPETSLALLVLWLIGLGFVRRLVDAGLGPTRLDPLLLVAPLAWVLLVSVASRQGAFAAPSRLANWVLALSGIVFVEALNPLHGSPLAGAAGLLFVLVPMFAFWVGRQLETDVLSRVLRLYGFAAIAAALYGMLQTFSSFPPWDERWIQASGYGSLNISGVIRPFSMESSAGEYSFVLACGIVIWLSPLFRRTPRLVVYSVVALLGAAMLFESSRSPVVMLAVGIAAMVSCRLGRGFMTLTLTVLVSLLLVTAVAGSLAKQFGGSSRRSTLVQHQLSGLARPTDPANSTLWTHIGIVSGGLQAMVHNPVGTGPGSVTIAGARFGGIAGSTEADPSNIAVAGGVPGFVAYVILAILALRLAVSRARESRSAIALASVGIVFVTLFEWLNGGQYAVAFLPWLVLGYLDQPEATHHTRARE
jgi:hypothetical protein